MFRTDNYKIHSEKIKKPVTVVMLADLHNHLHGEYNRELLDKIRETAPDFVCIAGDMLIGNSKIPFTVAQECVLELAKICPVFYGLGNHEARMREWKGLYGTGYEDYMGPLREAGVKILVNEQAVFEIHGQRFIIHGYSLPMKYFEKFNRYHFETEELTKVLGSCEEEGYHILLAHNPVYFKQYAAWGADLTLSGHLHGGIIRLPFLGGVITPQAKLLPRYSAGEYTIGQKKLIVSRGLGTHTIPIRFNNPPELSVICLTPSVM